MEAERHLMSAGQRPPRCVIAETTHLPAPGGFSAQTFTVQARADVGAAVHVVEVVRPVTVLRPTVVNGPPSQARR